MVIDDSKKKAVSFLIEQRMAEVSKAESSFNCNLKLNKSIYDDESKPLLDEFLSCLEDMRNNEVFIEGVEEPIIFEAEVRVMSYEYGFYSSEFKGLVRIAKSFYRLLLADKALRDAKEWELLIDELNKLGNMYKKGILTDKEFGIMKKKLIEEVKI